MRIPFRERFISWAVPVLLAAVLLGLAFLQYRWSAQVSEAASTRMRASLQNSLLNFREDLERELTAMCLEMQSEPGRPLDPATLAERAQLWETTSAQPGMVAGIYWWNRSGLFHLSLTDRKFELVEWPGRFAGVHNALNESFRIPLVNARLRRLHPRGNRNVAPQLHHHTAVIDQSIPMLIFPAESSKDGGWLLLELDKAVLRDDVFPRLVERNFGNPHDSEYEVSIIEASDSTSQIVYSSSPAETAQSVEVDSDATLNLFGPPGSTKNPAIRDARGGMFVAAMPFAKNGAVNDLFVVHFEPIRNSTSDSVLEITARHRKGSVEAAVAGLRRRNLTLSFGVLLVLGASISLILFNAQRARRLAAIQMDFVTGVSHELRTPVAAILSASENIADGLVDNQQQMVRYGTMIKNQARQLNHLVEQVLRFASTRRNAMAYNIRPLSIGVVIDEALQSTASAEAAGCRIETDIAPDLPPIAADPGALSQCLQNLITNAVKYGGESKWVGIRAHLDHSRDYVLVTVEDHGIGVAPRELRQIFEPFYRSPSVMSSHVHGTGLGLSLARTFAEAMGGDLTAQSEVGKGTTFTVRLPVATRTNSSESLLSMNS